jgi:inosose dehydratase
MFRPYRASYDQPMTATFLQRIASAPISWGICEVPGWGAMLPIKRVLSEMTSLGLPATELGAPGFFSDDSAELKDQLAEFKMSMIGGFTPVVLHDKSQEKATIEAVLKTSKKFQEIGATHLVSSPVQSWDWANPEELSSDEVTQFFKVLAEVDQICKDHGLVQVVHPSHSVCSHSCHLTIRPVEDVGEEVFHLRPQIPFCFGNECPYFTLP